MKNMFMHLTNFTLNKNSEQYVAQDDEWTEDGPDEGSKRLLSTLWKIQEDEDYDVEEI